MQLVVPIAVRNAVSAATKTFTASSTILCFFIDINFLLTTDFTDFTDLNSFRSALPLATEGTQEFV